MRVKNVLFRIGLITCGIMMLASINANMSYNTLALGYQNPVDIQFTFEPMLSVSLSAADLVIEDLTPGTSGYSNTISIDITTNNIVGYTLSAKVGDGTTYTDNTLVNSSNNGNTMSFASLGATDNLTLSNFTDNKWGYTLGTITNTNTYSGLLYNTDTTINATTNAAGTAKTGYLGTNTTSFTIGAKASSDIPSGDYNNVIVFTAISNVVDLPQTYIMQEVADWKDDLAEGDMVEAIDSRDGQVYKVARLKDGKIWMLDNLALDPTDPTTAANMNASNTNATQAAINNLLNGGNSGNPGWSSTAVADVDTSFYNGYTVPRINNASKDTLVTSYGPAATNGQAKVGIYYNYCAASAGTYCYANRQGVDLPNTLIDAPQDLCPANWRMPTGGYTGEYMALYNKYNTTMDATNPNSFQYNLSTPLSGDYYFSPADGQGDWGAWWSSTYYNGYVMYRPGVNSSNVSPYNSDTRDYGYSMRCLVGD